jgi:hypothetical protein
VRFDASMSDIARTVQPSSMRSTRSFASGFTGWGFSGSRSSSSLLRSSSRASALSQVACSPSLATCPATEGVPSKAGGAVRPGSNALDGSAALTAGLDVSSALLSKLETDDDRYPASQFRGRFRRPQRGMNGES